MLMTLPYPLQLFAIMSALYVVIKLIVWSLDQFIQHNENLRMLTEYKEIIADVQKTTRDTYT